MDGNGRWAKNHGMPRAYGHRAGIKSINRVVSACSVRQIQELTLFAFSSENWKRPDYEVTFLLSLFEESIDLYVIGVHYKCCGDDSYDASDTGDETTRRHHASLLLTDYIINNRSNDNVIVLGDFNNTGSQSIVNPTLSPFTDQNNYDSATSFKMTDLSILQGPATGYSWQGWTSSYSAAHFDHIIINQSMFTVDATSATSVIALPTETGLSNSNVSNRISDHQPVMYRFYP